MSINEQTSVVHKSLAALLREILEGPAPEAAWVLNRGDHGLLRSLDKLSAAAASVVPAGGGSSIAAHVDHLRYGLSLLNRWNKGQDPFGDADYSASWRRVSVSESEWKRLCGQLRTEADAWREVVRTPRELSEFDLTGLISSVAHLAYHLGAIRQIDRSIRGPAARD
jgi:hypothetical protein